MIIITAIYYDLKISVIITIAIYYDLNIFVITITAIIIYICLQL